MPRKKLDLANEVNENISKLDKKEVEIVNKPDFELMTMRDYEEEKKLLASRRMKVVTQLDGFKLEQAKKVTLAMEDILDQIIFDKEMTPFDKNQLMQAYERALKTLGNLVRLDTVDGSGKAARLALEVKFGNGTSVKTMIEG